MDREESERIKASLLNLQINAEVCLLMQKSAVN